MYGEVVPKCSDHYMMKSYQNHVTSLYEEFVPFSGNFSSSRIKKLWSYKTTLVDLKINVDIIDNDETLNNHESHTPNQREAQVPIQGLGGAMIRIRIELA